MKKHCRKIAIVITAIYFVLTTANVILASHFAEHDKDTNHHSENCSICQQGIINKNSAILQPSSNVSQVNEISCVVCYEIFFSPQIVHFQFPPLRAPPSVY